LILGRDNTKRDALKPASCVAAEFAARLADVSSQIASTNSGDLQDANAARLPVDVLIGPGDA
jgi:hypothetical protein